MNHSRTTHETRCVSCAQAIRFEDFEDLGQSQPKLKLPGKKKRATGTQCVALFITHTARRIDCRLYFHVIRCRQIYRRSIDGWICYRPLAGFLLRVEQKKRKRRERNLMRTSLRNFGFLDRFLFVYPGRNGRSIDCIRRRNRDVRF